jgi:acyl-CoA synthetase (NDP forming)
VAVMEKLRETVPEAGSIAGNPLDDVQTFLDPAYFASVLDLVCRDPAMGMVIVDRVIQRKAFHLRIPQRGFTQTTIQQVKQRNNGKPVVFVIESEGGDSDQAAQGANLRSEFGKGGIPAYPSVKRAARALIHLYRYYNRLGRIKRQDV